MIKLDGNFITVNKAYTNGIKLTILKHKLTGKRIGIIFDTITKRIGINYY